MLCEAKYERERMFCGAIESYECNNVQSGVRGDCTPVLPAKSLRMGFQWQGRHEARLGEPTRKTRERSKGG